MQIELNSQTISSVAILRLTGRLDTLNANPVKAWIDQATADKPANLIVNLQGVSFVDSTGLAVLVAGMKRSREMEGDLRICGLQTPVRMIFELTRLDIAFEIFNSEDQAIRAFTV